MTSFFLAQTQKLYELTPVGEQMGDDPLKFDMDTPLPGAAEGAITDAAPAQQITFSSSSSQAPINLLECAMRFPCNNPPTHMLISLAPGSEHHR